MKRKIVEVYYVVEWGQLDEFDSSYNKKAEGIANSFWDVLLWVSELSRCKPHNLDIKAIKGEDETYKIKSKKSSFIARKLK